MRVTALVLGATIAGSFLPANIATAAAQAPSETKTKSAIQAQADSVASLSLLADIKEVKQPAGADLILKVDKPEEETTQEPKPVEHTVAEGDTLTSIAHHHKTEWIRLWQKNTELAHPDQLKVGDKVIIPRAEEELKPRELPEPPVMEVPAAPDVGSSASRTVQTAPTRQYSRGSSAGNTYTAGYCTWYVKNMRPDLPNNLGNADTWVSRARAQGIPTGSTPRAGAVGQRGMHVVYVESVNADGSVNISEMNHRARWEVTYRTLPRDYFTYIY